RVVAVQNPGTEVLGYRVTLRLDEPIEAGNGLAELLEWEGIEPDDPVVMSLEHDIERVFDRPAVGVGAAHLEAFERSVRTEARELGRVDVQAKIDQSHQLLHGFDERVAAHLAERRGPVVEQDEVVGKEI